MDFEGFFEQLRAAPGYGGQIAHLAAIPPRAATYAGLGAELCQEVKGILSSLGIERLYSHQAAAIEAALGGENVAVVAGAAGGKSLCFTIPLAQRIHERRTSRALLIYPTKALAQDQLRRLAAFGAGTVFSAGTYDGDTPTERRRQTRRDCQVILTNPDMLHLGILPYHRAWADFFANLKFVVLDEMHIYRGVFGSHTANIMRRLRRVARLYGADPRFICCSATIGNPRELCEALTGLEFRLVDEDGSPSGPRTFVIWQPPLIQRRSGRRRSANLEAAELLAHLVRHGVRTIVFTLARRQAELILRYAQEALRGDPTRERIMSYRGGYLPAERRQIEQRLFDGSLLGVISTTALELGVDIGGLDAALLVGYPGSVASTWQQAGRAGRGQQPSLSALIALPGGIHRYLVERPEYLLDREVERVTIDPQNRFIMAAHLLCAAYELPLDDQDSVFFGQQMTPILQVLQEAGYLTRRQRWYWSDPDTYPAASLSIRSASGTSYEIRAQAGNALLGTADDATAFMLIHPGAVYLHAGESYLITGLDTERRIAFARPAHVGYYTQALVVSEVRVSDETGRRRLGRTAAVGLGPVAVTTTVVGFRKVRQITEQPLGEEPLDLPPRSFESVGVWLTLGADEVAALGAAGCDLMGSLHALEHAMIALLPLFALCDPHDAGGMSRLAHEDTGGASILIYDGAPGGVGICEMTFARIEGLLQAAAETICACPCDDGCPSCVQAAQCGDGNFPLDKRGATVLAQALLGGATLAEEAADGR